MPAPWELAVPPPVSDEPGLVWPPPEFLPPTAPPDDSFEAWLQAQVASGQPLPPESVPAPMPGPYGYTPPSADALQDPYAAQGPFPVPEAPPAAPPAPEPAQPLQDVAPAGFQDPGVPYDFSGALEQLTPQQRVLAAEQGLINPAQLTDDDRYEAGVQTRMMELADASLPDLALADEVAQARAKRAAQKGIDKGLDVAESRAQEAEAQYAQVTAHVTRRLMEIDARAQELAGAEVNPDRWWESRSTAQTFAAVAASVLGGLSEFRTGRNSALDRLQGFIQQDIAAQVQNIELGRQSIDAQRGVVAQLMQQGLDVQEAAGAANIAALELVKQRAASVLASTDPTNTAAIDALQAYRTVEAQQAAVQADLKQKLAKLELDQQAQVAKEWKDRQDASVAWANHKLGRDKYTLEVGDVGFDNIQGAVKQATDAGLDGRKAATAEMERLHKNGVGGVHIIGPDGKRHAFVHGGQESEVAKGRSIVAGRNVLQWALKEALALREKHGPDWMNSKEDAAAVFQIQRAAAAGYGMLQTTGGEIEGIDKSVGGGNLASVRDPIGALERMSRNADVWAQSFLDQGLSLVDRERISGSQTGQVRIDFVPYQHLDEVTKGITLASPLVYDNKAGKVDEEEVTRKALSKYMVKRALPFDLSPSELATKPDLLRLLDQDLYQSIRQPIFDEAFNKTIRQTTETAPLRSVVDQRAELKQLQAHKRTLQEERQRGAWDAKGRDHEDYETTLVKIKELEKTLAKEPN